MLHPRLAKKKHFNVLLHDNAPSHTALSTIELINTFMAIVAPSVQTSAPPPTPHPPCYLFPELKKKACRKQIWDQGGFNFNCKSVPQQ